MIQTAPHVILSNYVVKMDRCKSFNFTILCKCRALRFVVKIKNVNNRSICITFK